MIVGWVALAVAAGNRAVRSNLIMGVDYRRILGTRVSAACAKVPLATTAASHYTEPGGGDTDFQPAQRRCIMQ